MKIDHTASFLIAKLSPHPQEWYASGCSNTILLFKPSFLKLTTVLLILATFVLGACGKKEATGLAAIKEKGQLIIGLDDTFAPMGFKDDKGEIVGFDIDLAKEVAKRIGVEAVFKPSEWSGIVFELKSKNIDVVWNGMTITEDRNKEIGFSNPYMNNNQIIVTLSGSTLNNKADLNGKIIGLQLGSSSFNAVSADEISKSFKEIKKYDTNVEALMDLEAGRIEAVVLDEIVARYYIAQKEKDTNKDLFKVLDGDFGTEEYGVGIRQEDKDLKDEIDRIIDEMKKDGSYDAIYEKWFGKKG